MLYDYKIKRAILKMRGQYDKNVETHSYGDAIDIYKEAKKNDDRTMKINKKDLPAIILTAYIYTFAIAIALFIGILLICYLFFWRHAL